MKRLVVLLIVAFALVLGACAVGPPVPPGGASKVVEWCEDGTPYAVVVMDGQHEDFDAHSNSSDFWHRDTRFVRPCGGIKWIQTVRQEWHRFAHCNWFHPGVFCDNPFLYQGFLG